MTTPAPQPMDDLLNAGQTALQALETEKKRLLNDDGTRVYSDAEHSAREVKLLEDFNTKIAELVTQVEQRAADVTAAADEPTRRNRRGLARRVTGAPSGRATQ